MDLALTATERIHAFTRPLDKGGQFTRYDVSGAVKDKFTHKFDFDLDTLFFEGDLGQITGGLHNKAASFDLPIAFGRMPFVTQNGVWIEDAFDGAAFSFTAKNIPSLDVSNTDLTFFAGWAQLTTDAAPNSSRNGVFGLAGFADARKGYIEYGYGYVKADDDNLSTPIFAFRGCSQRPSDAAITTAVNASRLAQTSRAYRGPAHRAR